MKYAIKCACKLPKKVATDKLPAYLDGRKLALHGEFNIHEQRERQMANANRYEGIEARATEVLGTGVRGDMPSSERLSETVEQVTEIGRRMFNGCGLSVLLVDKEGSELIFKVATGKAGKGLKGLRISTRCGIAGWVANH